MHAGMAWLGLTKVSRLILSLPGGGSFFGVSLHISAQEKEKNYIYLPYVDEENSKYRT